MAKTLLCEYVTATGRHALLAVTDERSLTYRVLFRDPHGSTSTLREFVPSLRHAALHYRHRALLEDLDRTADLGRAC